MTTELVVEHSLVRIAQSVVSGAHVPVVHLDIAKSLLLVLPSWRSAFQQQLRLRLVHVMNFVRHLVVVVQVEVHTVLEVVVMEF